MSIGCFALGYITDDKYLKVYLFNSARTREILCSRICSFCDGIVLTYRDGYNFEHMVREAQIDKRVTFIDGEEFLTAPARAIRNGNYPRWEGSEFKKLGFYSSPLKARLFRRKHPERLL